ncbi:ABC transporter substrate-binding protein [Halomarina pelagica]|uniref:ABC transporter substrate-binding protein n=1 Tax=Halomarina pelagica TaxID=2961599 RepID=UPI0020C3A1DB|nr:ABC transporter substrate-binding protein [Halomarina sp. BND7]
MGYDAEPRGSPTRREFAKYGGAVIGGGLLAGCTGQDESGSTGGPDPADTKTGAASQDTATENSYSVTMSPVGTLEFERPPKDLFVVFQHFADMATALGFGDLVQETWYATMTRDTLGTFCGELDVTTPDWDAVESLRSWPPMTKERLYELDRDIHLVDPVYLTTTKGWEQADIDEISQNVGPWFGNTYSGSHGTPPKAHQETYEYYTLWEIFERFAQIFREQERYEALVDLHTEVIEEIESNLPPKSERPTVTRLNFTNDTFYAYHLNDPGFWLADSRPFELNDVFADREWDGLWSSFGYEEMLEADPDVILNLWGMTEEYPVGQARETIKSHSVGKNLSAIKNDRFYPHGIRYQGPIMNLFQMEMIGKQVYPEQFGEWPEYRAGDPYPDFPEERQLFDRERLSNIINGDL